MDLEAVKDVNLELAGGELVGIYGISGSGKTTLLNLLGLLEEPSSGKILVEGNEINQFSEDEKNQMRNTLFGYLHQAFGLLKDFTVFENVEIPLLLGSLSEEDRRIQILHILQVLGIIPQMNKLPRELSGGQAQRVALARAMVTKPRILLTDEPTGSLDSQSGIRVVKELKKLSRLEQNPPAILMVTHDESYLHFFDRVYRMEDGRISKY